MVVALVKKAQAFGFKWPSYEHLIKKIQDECQEVAQEIAHNNRLLSKLTSGREFEGGSEKRTGVYMEVHEDSFPEPTPKLPAEAEFGKKFNTRLEEELGDLVLASLSFCVFLKVDPKKTIEEACSRFQMLQIAKEDKRASCNGMLAVTNYGDNLKKDITLQSKDVLEEVVLLEKQARDFKWCNDQDWVKQIYDKCKEIEEEMKTLRRQQQLHEMLGDLILINLSFCIFYNFEPKEIIKKSYLKFQDRINTMIKLAKADGYHDFNNSSVEIIMKYWNASKNHTH